MNGKQVARALGWFGIGLGLAECLAPRAVARASGLRGHERLLQAFGLREIASGLVLLDARDSERWVWLRSAGDGLDGALLTYGLRPGNPHRHRTLLATIAVAPAVALDLLYTARANRHRAAGA